MWLAGLDADDYAVREAASRHLIEAGEAAIDVLAEGVGSTSAEAAWRASSALEQIALQGNETALTRVSAALERLSQQGRPGLARLAQRAENQARRSSATTGQPPKFALWAAG